MDAPDPDTGEPAMFTPEDLEVMNAELERTMGEPLDLSGDIE